MKKTTMKKGNSKSVCRWFIAGILALGLVLSCSEPEPTPTDEGLQGKISSTSWENDLYEYLLSMQGGKTSHEPVEIKVAIQLTESNWLKMLMILQEFGVYTILDLSDCDFSDSNSSSTGGLDRGRQFNPMPSVSTGKQRIVKLVLPAACTGITASFSYFSSLKTIEADNITTIPSYAFSGLANIDSVHFPQLRDIEYNAFYNCSSLKEIRLPATANVASNPFVGCRALVNFDVIGTGSLSSKENGTVLVRNETELVSYPSARSGSVSLSYVTALGKYSMSGISSTEFEAVNVVTVEENAFYNCSLVSVSLPKAVTLGDFSFYGSSDLAKLFIPNVKKIGAYALASTGNSPIEITLGQNPPDTGPGMFNYNNTRVVTLKIPSLSAERYDETWKNAFRGKGTEGNGTAANSNITLKFEEYTP